MAEKTNPDGNKEKEEKWRPSSCQSPGQRATSSGPFKIPNGGLIPESRHSNKESKLLGS